MSEATILCIDDDVAALSLLVERFEEAGYDVLRASDFDHSYVLFEESSPDLVTLEVGLQRGRGWELLEQLVTAGARVIVISSHGLVEDVVRGIELGAVDFISKPYRSDEVLARARLRLQQSLPERSSLEPLGAAPDSDEEPVPADAPPEADVDEAPANEPVAAAETPAEERAESPFAATDEFDAISYAAEEPLPGEEQGLGGRLRSARRLRNISLVQAELETRIRMYYIQALEEERFALLPRGSATERIISDYATFLGVNPQEALAEYRSRYRASDEPVHDLGGGEEIDRPLLRHARTALLATAVVLALSLTIGGLVYFAPTGIMALWNNARALVAPSPTATLTPAPTITPLPASATPEPTSTPPPTPTVRPTDTPRPSATSATPGTPGTVTTTPGTTTPGTATTTPAP